MLNRIMSACGSHVCATRWYSSLDLNRRPRDPRSTQHIVPQNVFIVVVALACEYFPEYHPTVTVACGETQSHTVIFDTLDYAYSNDKGAESEVMSDVGFPMQF